MKVTLNLSLYVALLLVGASSISMAANDGLLGTSSQGDTSITLTVGELVQITGIDDIPMTYSPGSNGTGSDPSICVYSNAALGYRITADSANFNGGFRLRDGTNGFFYSVGWTDSDGILLFLTEGVTSANRAGSAFTDCSGDSKFASVTLTAQEANILAVPAGNYSDTLTVLITPAI